MRRAAPRSRAPLRSNLQEIRATCSRPKFASTSPPTSSAMMSSGLPTFLTCASSGSKSFWNRSFPRRGKSGILERDFHTSVGNEVGERYPQAKCTRAPAVFRWRCGESRSWGRLCSMFHASQNAVVYYSKIRSHTILISSLFRHRFGVCRISALHVGQFCTNCEIKAGLGPRPCFPEVKFLADENGVRSFDTRCPPQHFSAPALSRSTIPEVFHSAQYFERGERIWKGSRVTYG